jgi:hypothetical protein
MFASKDWVGRQSEPCDQYERKHCPHTEHHKDEFGICVCGWWKAEHEGNDTSHLDAIEAMHKPSGVDHSQFWEAKGSDEPEKNQISFDV